MTKDASTTNAAMGIKIGGVCSEETNQAERKNGEASFTSWSDEGCSTFRLFPLKTTEECHLRSSNLPKLDEKKIRKRRRLLGAPTSDSTEGFVVGSVEAAEKNGLY